MKSEQRKEIKNKVQEEVYAQTLSSLMWHRDYHENKMLEYLSDNEDYLFVINYENYIAYDKLIKAFNHFKF